MHQPAAKGTTTRTTIIIKSKNGLVMNFINWLMTSMTSDFSDYPVFGFVD